MDRDGTINVLKEDEYHLADPKKVTLIPGVEKLIKKFNPEQDVYDIQAVISEKLKALNGAYINDWAYCFHHFAKGIGKYKIDCNCRKPGTENVEKMVKKYDIDKSKSFFIGDNITDAKCAENAGIRLRE